MALCGSRNSLYSQYNFCTAQHCKGRREGLKCTQCYRTMRCPLPRSDASAKGPDQTPVAEWARSHAWLQGLGTAVRVPVTTHSSAAQDNRWEGNRENDFYCNTLSVGEGPGLLIFLWHRHAHRCRQTAPQPGWTVLPADFLSSRTSRLSPLCQSP